ncbi:MAG TPA: DegT/DnrJ/EryC1/StrS family aminotransferase [Dehalococcoidia bacterium]|nr:DegT/DnrJ/EryC1/StrS family aminotransferase [Dehalococcoidia bacterium]
MSGPIPVIDLKRQHAAMRDELDAAIARVIDSGWFIGGPETKAFESEWAAYCGVEHAVALGSGTAALNLTLRGLGIGPGDEVITVAFTLSATLDAISDTGATPVLVDVDASTYTLDASKLEAAITRRTRAVLPVHIYGHPADMDAIGELAERYGLPVVSDACEAHGALYRGRQVTEYGTASCFSFYPTKNLNALGDAGAIVTDDAALAEHARRLSHHGWDRRFHSAERALNSRMDEIHAAVLRLKLGRLDAWNNRRRAIAKRYDEALAGTSIAAATKASWAEPSYYLYVVATPQRDALRAALTEAGIATDVHWPEPPHLQPAYADLGYGRGSLPVTERLCDEVLTIPMFPEMTEAEVSHVCEALRRFGTK